MCKSASRNQSFGAYVTAPTRWLRQLIEDRRGATLIMVGLTIVPMIGIAGLATEVGMWYFTRRSMQDTADSSAYSAAVARFHGVSKDIYTAEARSVAGKFGYVNGTGGVTVTVNNPPTLGNYKTDSNAIEVIISEPQTAAVSGLFLASAPTITARAVALAGTPGNGCVLALDGASVDDIFNNGNVNIQLKGCDIYDNSPNASALTVVGTASISANGAYIVGNYTTSGGGQFTTTPVSSGGDGTNVNWSSPIADPYAGYLSSFTSPSNCDYNNQRYQGHANVATSSFTSGQVFCGGINITGNSAVNFPAGVFYINGGSLSVAGGSTLNATAGTTFVLTGNASVSFAGGANINVVGSASGPFPGTAFAADTPSTAGNSSFQGGDTMNITGAVYFPHNSITWAGGSNVNGTPCVQLIAQTIDFKGNATFGTNCAGYGFPTAGIGKVPTKLVE
ncbi:MAG: pilus assembly protein TadG-related protein [Acidobacteriota bacterium]